MKTTIGFAAQVGARDEPDEAGLAEGGGELRADAAARVRALPGRLFFEGITDRLIVDPSYDVLALRRKEKRAAV